MTFNVAHRRQFLIAATNVAKKTTPSEQDFADVCNGLAQLISDATGQNILLVARVVSDHTALQQASQLRKS